LSICSVTEFEIFVGAQGAQLDFWNCLLIHFQILPFDGKAALVASSILKDPKQKRKSIDKAHLFIAAIAMANNLRFHTLNQKHFYTIECLTLCSHIIT